MAFTIPPERGFTVPMAAALPMAESRACTSGIRSGKAMPVPAAVSGLRARTRSRTSRRMAISSAFSTGRPPRPGPGGGDDGGQAASRRELANQGGHLGAGGLHHVAEHAFDGVLLKDAQIAISVQVHLV